MKILLSGGWGYGNLGDDAILIASLNLLKEKYPHSEITVMSYDFQETMKILNKPDIKVIPSIHRIISGELSFKKFGAWKKSFNYYPFPKLLFRRIKKIQNHSIKSQTNKIFHKMKNLSEFEKHIKVYDEFKNADLFVMSGGAYINGWLDSLCSRVLELKITKETNTKSLIIGQTIGPFKKTDLASYAKSGLELADKVSVRDIGSYEELQSLGINCNIAPDLALSDIHFTTSKTPTISVVLGDLSVAYMDILCDTFSIVSKKTNCTFKLLMTRLYNRDVASMKIFSKKMKKYSIKTNEYILLNINDIQNEIMNSKVIISRNLHGLILGWRAGIPCVCLNTGRKFVSFMEQSKQTERMIGYHELDKPRLTKMILDAYNTQSSNELRTNISNQIKQNFFDCLDEVMQSNN